MTYVQRFTELGLTDSGEAGGKGANLGELTGMGLQVPDGFVLLASAFVQSMGAAGVLAELDATHEAALSAVADEVELTRLCARMAELVDGAGMDPEVRLALGGAYQDLGKGDQVNVAVRSSAVGEDGNDASFAGM